MTPKQNIIMFIAFTLIILNLWWGGQGPSLWDTIRGTSSNSNSSNSNPNGFESGIQGATGIPSGSLGEGIGGFFNATGLT